MVKRDVDGRASKKMTSREMQEILIENFVGLQAAMTNLSIKFENLAGQMRNLLEIFELSAKNFISQDEKTKDTPENKDLMEKMNILLDQNRTLARGLVLLEEKLRNREPSPVHPVQSAPKNDFEDYEESAISREKKAKPLPRI
jgi:hypothetical protein